MTSTATGSAAVHRSKKIRWAFPPFNLNFIRCTDSGSCNKSRQALDDDLVPAVKLCRNATEEIISEGLFITMTQSPTNGGIFFISRKKISADFERKRLEWIEHERKFPNVQKWKFLKRYFKQFKHLNTPQKPAFGSFFFIRFGHIFFFKGGQGKRSDAVRYSSSESRKKLFLVNSLGSLECI